jgi:lysophospholipase L1-like esterase
MTVAHRASSPVARFLAGELLLLLGLAGAIEGGGRAAVALGVVPGEELQLNGPLLVRPHPFLGFCLREGTVGRAGSKAEQHINSQGYRGRAVGPKTKNTFRVLCLGDSVTYGDSLAEGDTMPAQLERELKNRIPNQTVEVVNFGVLQYTSAESFAAFALRGVDLHPDVVVIYEGANDIAPRFVRPFRGDYAQFRAVFDREPDQACDRPLETSVGYRVLRWLAGVFPAAQRLDWYTVQKLPALTPPQKDLAFKGSSGEPLIHNERAELALARAHGARTLLVSPGYNRFTEGDHSYAARSFRENRFRQERAAKSQGGGFLDLTLILDSKADFRDPVHFTKEGARSVASKIATEMEKLGWLPK